jgi:hypothetical protein
MKGNMDTYKHLFSPMFKFLNCLPQLPITTSVTKSAFWQSFSVDSTLDKAVKKRSNEIII